MKALYDVGSGDVVRRADRRTVATLEADGWTCTTWATDAEALVVRQTPAGYTGEMTAAALDLAHAFGIEALAGEAR